MTNTNTRKHLATPTTGSAIIRPRRPLIVAPFVPLRAEAPLTPYAGLRPRAIFHGTERGLATYYEVRSPGRQGRRAIIGVNQATADKVTRANRHPAAECYECDPEGYERSARLKFADVAPEILTAIAYAKSRRLSSPRFTDCRCPANSRPLRSTEWLWPTTLVRTFPTW